MEYRRGAKSHRWEDSWSDGTGRRGDPRNETSEPALRTPSTGVEATPRRARGSSLEREYDVVSMTFLTDTIKKRYRAEEIFAVLFESEQDRKRRRMLAIVTETVDAHRLQKMRDLLAFEKLATWRRMNGFDRVVNGEDN